MAAGKLASATTDLPALLSALDWLSLASPTPPLSAFLVLFPRPPAREWGWGAAENIYT